jgi:hypothetical protein
MTQTQPQNAAVSPDPSGDSKNFKQQLMDRVRAGGGTKTIDTKQLFQNLVKDTLEAFLELELEEHLGYPKHDPEGRGSGNPQRRHAQDGAGRFRRGGDRNTPRSQQ